MVLDFSDDSNDISDSTDVDTNDNVSSVSFVDSPMAIPWPLVITLTTKMRSSSPEVFWRF